MNLARMTDVIGMRLVVRTRAEQDEVLGLMLDLDGVAATRNYVDHPQVSGYRAHHLFVNVASSPGGLRWPVEIQIRTLAQHYWSSLSESFGEAVKEGRGSVELREWLVRVSAVLAELEAAKQPLAFSTPSPAGSYGPVEIAVLMYNLSESRLDGYLNCGGSLDLALSQQSFLEQRNLASEQYEAVLLLTTGENRGQLSHMRYFSPLGRPPLPDLLLDEVGPIPLVTTDIWTPET